ncbi:protein MCM10 homolog [Phymastichus coffea]|uniref:protein MCM10 homolog n=1 Tax=Phymastichus coffea TaxID=108790 RepID=UPI00273ABDE2|nr:protein MCM10 homolog [Phymastichus coffea]
MSSDESDDDLINLLVSNADDSAKSHKDNTTQQSKPHVLKELDHSFLDDSSYVIEDETPKIVTPKANIDKTSIVDNHANSSDDEDAKYFEKQSYSEYGQEIKQLLKNRESQKADQSFLRNFKKENVPVNVTSNSSSLSSNFNSATRTNSKYSLQVQSSPLIPKQKDVYCDPIFGLRIIKPLVSSAELTERMNGRKAVTVSNVKLHLTVQSNSDQNTDWVIAGVLLSKSATKTSQKGSQYCIWKLSDLSTDMKAVTVFLFSGAYKTFWKLNVGSVVGILNPSVLESRDDKDLATLSVDNPMKVMVLGTSKDLGKCKSVKKNGEPCTAPVNLSICEYCVYHIKQEYGKFSKRSEFQISLGEKSFGNVKNSLKQMGLMQQRHPEAKPFLAIPAKRNEALYKKDCERLALLRGGTPSTLITQIPKPKVKTANVELTPQQVKKDFERLNKLRQLSTINKSTCSIINEEKKPNFKLSLSTPKLGNGMKNGIIDFSEPINKNTRDKAKLEAIELSRKVGGFQKTNPNKVRPDKAAASEKGLKRRRDEEETEAEAVTHNRSAKKANPVINRFQKMLEMKSTHSDLIEKREDEQTDEYFKKLEVKERMEEKMLSTYKVDCKAVRCVICKYVAFSSSDLCKKLQHPIKVIDAVKRFFKCADCRYRTVTLDRIPTETCKRCASSKWIKTAMMDERRTEIASSKLCIRGGEEKYIGSVTTDANLDLVVPD